ncbi:hypothetical protein [Mesorhizobium caraganae]|uniref:hypothetical protein n=1 Tax=Mesorhizobium caraganae TaxID=483206 RepID=UPI00177C61B9|nr:hypothetical protein [Mesorhizobium caraganae]
MKDKTPWYIYPQEQPKRRPSGDDPVALLVGFLLMSIFVFVALDHAVYQIWTFALRWWEALRP